ncbi:MAG: class F sortase [Brachybacterium sp.]|nr:class F sortase [Brachybacterium sp.]
MSPARTRLRDRLIPLALLVIGLAVAGWAVLALLRGPITADASLTAPPAEQAGSAAAAPLDPSGSPDPLTETGINPENLPEPTTVATPTDPAVVPDGRSSAQLEAVTGRAMPVAVSFSALDREAPVVPVGVDENGQMEIPDARDHVGWFRHGPSPEDGEGSVVLASHIDTREGAGVFTALADAKAGDAVVVDLSDGTEATYVLTGATQVPKSELPAGDVFRRDGDPELQLITCAGRWDPVAGAYTDNLIFTARMTGTDAR